MNRRERIHRDRLHLPHQDRPNHQLTGPPSVLQRMKISQKLIADRLGLSRTTVSRCFTNHPKINPETRSAVFQLAAELGYEYQAPRNVAERKVSDRNTIAVLIGVGQAVDTTAELIKGISEHAAMEKLEMQLHYIDSAEFRLAPRARRILPGVNSSEWKGTILLYPFHEATVDNLKAKFPTVSVLDDYDTVDVDCLNPDEGRGITHMMQHLYDLGHRRIGFMSWKYPIATPWVGRRLGVYVENLYRLGVEFDPRLTLNVNRDDQIPLDDLARQVAALVRDGVTAWVCAADHQAYWLLDALDRLGVRVPEDCSITGFDGVKPPDGKAQLTTVRAPLREIGFSSVISLLRRIGHRSAPRRHILVSCREIIGESTARPPGGSIPGTR